MEQSSTSGAKRKRGRPRKYEYPSYEQPQRAQPIQSIPPLQSTQGSSNIRQDGVQVSHKSGDSIGPKMFTFQVLPAQQAQGNRSGRSRNSANLVKTSGKDDILGKHFVAPSASTKSSSKQASAVPLQAAAPVPIHLEDVTLAKPLQMRRPVDKTTAKHAIPLTVRPYMGSGVVAAVPVSVSPSNVEIGTLAKQDTECMISQPPVAAVPITSVRPVFVSDKQVANQNELVREKSLNDVQKDSKSSNVAKDSSVKAEKLNAALVDVVVKDSPGEKQLLNVQGSDGVEESSGKHQHVNATVNDENKIALGTGDQPNSANCEHQISKEPSDIVEKSDLLKTQNVVMKGVEVDGSKSVAPDWNVSAKLAGTS
ncbi:hypothetical protein PR202_gb14308 [Eleusine coracana subsp. coracana]|uniref:Uncharacterized protein n=1 Tax=Eleusine coracana subsp. coracana TaxID=191504 RepID=A0AAV5EUX1_ELECO|nr:hypothetical protein PR202_gb14308 [Eleusine coracana subsp. coracana]